MATRFVDWDELYPYFSLSSTYGRKEADFTDEELARIEAALVEFDAVQELIAQRVNYGR